MISGGMAAWEIQPPASVHQSELINSEAIRLEGFTQISGGYLESFGVVCHE